MLEKCSASFNPGFFFSVLGQNKQITQKANFDFFKELDSPNVAHLLHSVKSPELLIC